MPIKDATWVESNIVKQDEKNLALLLYTPYYYTDGFVPVSDVGGNTSTQLTSRSQTKL